MAAPVLLGILEIWEVLPVTPANNSGYDAFRVDGIGTGRRFWWPIPMGSLRGKTPQLPDTNRILLLNGRARPALSKDSGSCSTLLTRLRHMQSGTQIQLIYRHSPDGF